MTEKMESKVKSTLPKFTPDQVFKETTNGIQFRKWTNNFPEEATLEPDIKIPKDIKLPEGQKFESDIKIPENYSSSIKKGLPVEVKLSSFKEKIFLGEVDFVSSRINADTRSLLSRIKIENEDLELISGSLLEVSVKFNLRNSLSVPDTSVMIEGDKSYVFKINEENIANKTEVKTGLRGDKNIEIISGLIEGDIIVAEGLKKVRPRGKIKPIYK